MANDNRDSRGPGKRNSLVDAVRELKIATAERSDVVVEMKEADRARLEILAQELEPVFDEVPRDDERFDFALSSGLQPRLWIDATAHVMMGKDRRQYRFVRDTRLGRTVLAESNKTDPIAAAVTTYIAERLYEREMALAGDDVSYRPGVPQRNMDDVPAREPSRQRDPNIPKPLLMTPPFKEEAAEQPHNGKGFMGARELQSRIEPSLGGWLLLGIFIMGGAILLSM